MGTGGHNVPLLLDKYGIRKLTPRECLNFQGFPKSFKFPDDMPVSQRYKQAGNAVTVKLITKIAKIISKSLEVSKGPVKISKTYIPKDTEKYMCAKHLGYFKQKLMEWKKDLKRSNNEAIFNASKDDNSSSADIVDQASS